MLDFAYVRPASVEEACRLLTNPDQPARALAGGTDLMVELRDAPQRFRAVRALVDLKALPALQGISLIPNAHDPRRHDLALGALTTYAALATHPDVRGVAPVLVQAALSVGGPQIRNRGTIGGNLGTASPAGDIIPALMALRAEVELVGPHGTRRMLVSDFMTGPRQTLRQPDELIACVICPLPAAPEAWVWQWAKLGQRQAMAIAVAGVALGVELAAPPNPTLPPLIRSLSLVLSAVAPTTRHAVAAEQWAVGQPATEAVWRRIGELAAQSAQPISDVRGSKEYRAQVVVHLVHRTLREALARWAQVA